ncbi:hypothetical protein [Halalkalibacter akibai]|uniref:Uncharacterized protein n=1 Tax=Halalkalibacter akibai (strain ATCC 43226 / DSM 21942 / CIP 109018 / JCM 9157 / 1139) TaxID=1236973 RepID=W4QU55_HALA3|nr:hypothetical protein [Halalkalibacter akibai]GAE34864.1 hypothetical protein JCM9157_1945 [Halalkalibacter akibai JCM 9157]
MIPEDNIKKVIQGLEDVIGNTLHDKSDEVLLRKAIMILENQIGANEDSHPVIEYYQPEA